MWTLRIAPLTAVFSLFLVLQSRAQWVHVSGPYGPFMAATSLAVSGTDIFVGTRGAGILRSTDGDGTWTPVDSGFAVNQQYILSIGVNGTTLLAGTAGIGVFRSTNGGATWTQIGFDGGFVTSFAFIGTTTFAAVENNVVVRSTDIGTTWDTVNSGLEGNIWCLAPVGTDLFAGTLGVGGPFSPDSVGVYVTTNSGAHWAMVDSNLTCKVINCLAVVGSTPYAGTGFFPGYPGAYSARPTADRSGRR